MAYQQQLDPTKLDPQTIADLMASFQGASNQDAATGTPTIASYLQDMQQPPPSYQVASAQTQPQIPGNYIRNDTTGNVTGLPSYGDVASAPIRNNSSGSDVQRIMSFAQQNNVDPSMVPQMISYQSTRGAGGSKMPDVTDLYRQSFQWGIPFDKLLNSYQSERSGNIGAQEQNLKLATGIEGLRGEQIKNNMALNPFGVSMTPNSGSPASANAPMGTSPDQILNGDAFLQTLNPNAQALIKQYANGKMPISPYMAKTPQGIQLLEAITRYDPSFDAVDYNKRNRTAIGFASGSQGNAVRAANQALSHMGQLDTAINNLNNFNGVATPLNSIVNPIESALGDPRQGIFAQKANAISSELRKVFAASGGGGLAELEKWESSLPVNASQDQQRAYLKSGTDLMNGALGALNNQYQAGMGSKAQISDLLSPEARATLQKLSGSDESGTAPTSALTPSAPITPPQSGADAQAQAMQAIQRGADKAAVNARLQKMGYGAIP